MTGAGQVEWRLWSYDLPLTRPLAWGGAPFARRAGFIAGLRHPVSGWRYGEAAPLPGFTRESLATTRADLLDALATGVAVPGRHADAAVFALASAWQWGGLPAGPVRLNGLAEGTLAEIECAAGRLASHGAVKVKCALPDPQAAAARVRFVSELCPGSRIRADANRLFARGDAAALLRLLEPLDLEYIEEPCRDPDDLPGLHAAAPATPLALDETTRGSPERLARILPCARALVLKPSWTGAPERSAGLLALARAHGRSVTVSSALESGIGLRNLAAFIHASGLQAGHHGLDTARLLAEDLLAQPPRVAGGTLAFPSVQPDFSRLKEIAHGHHPLPPA